MAQCNHAERGADGEYPCTQTGNKGVSLRTAEIAEKEHVAVGESLRDGSFIFSSRNCKPPPPQRFAFEILSFAYTSHCSDFKSKQGSEGEYRGGLSPSFYPCAPCVSHTVCFPHRVASRTAACMPAYRQEKESTGPAAGALLICSVCGAYSILRSMTFLTSAVNVSSAGTASLSRLVVISLFRRSRKASRSAEVSERA